MELIAKTWVYWLGMITVPLVPNVITFVFCTYIIVCCTYIHYRHTFVFWLLFLAYAIQLMVIILHHFTHKQIKLKWNWNGFNVRFKLDWHNVFVNFIVWFEYYLLSGAGLLHSTVFSPVGVFEKHRAVAWLQLNRRGYHD